MVESFRSNCDLVKDTQGLATMEYLVLLLSSIVLLISSWSFFSDRTQESTEDAAVAIRRMEGRGSNASVVRVSGEVGKVGGLSAGDVSSALGVLPLGGPRSTTEADSSGEASESAFINRLQDFRGRESRARPDDGSKSLLYIPWS